jgi:uncharacterized protein (DUF433 family)
MMFETRKIGQFSVFSAHRDPLHRHRKGPEHRTAFFEELRVKQKQAVHRSFDTLSMREAYHRALVQCPSISVDARRQQGKPCIAGTRIPVHLVIWAVEQTGSIEGAMKSYPDLSEQQIKDALYFAETILGSPDGINETAPAA